MRGIKSGLDASGIAFGLLLLAVGVYYVLRNTLGLALDEIDWDRVWPLLVVGLGSSAIYKAWARAKEG